MFTTTHPTAARWINTGGDARVHLVPAGTRLQAEDDRSPEGFLPQDPFQVVTPVCGLGIFHGAWLHVLRPEAPLRECEACFTEWTNDAGTLPPLQGGGFRGGYRLFNVRDLPWDERTRVLARAEDGRGTCVIDGWGVSYTTGQTWEGGNPGRAADIAGVRLSAYKWEGPEEGFELHELNGTTYSTKAEATRAAYEAGLLAFMVYEDERIGAGR